MELNFFIVILQIIFTTAQYICTLFEGTDYLSLAVYIMHSLYTNFCQHVFDILHHFH